VIAEDAGLRVGRHENRADGFDARRVGGHELLPHRALSGFEIDTRWQFSRLIHVQRAIVGVPLDRQLAGIESGNQLGLASVYGIEIAFLIGADRCPSIIPMFDTAPGMVGSSYASLYI
jgi:hypothetical protein